MSYNDHHDPFQELFQKLLQQQQRQKSDKAATSYTLLLQHSQRVPTRAPSSSSVEEGVYRRAGVLPPWEAASRDFQAGSLWLKHVVEQLQEALTANPTASKKDDDNPSTREMVWLSTVPQWRNQRYSWIQKMARGTNSSSNSLSRIRIQSSLLVNPWNWEEPKQEDDGDDMASGSSLNSLEEIYDMVLKKRNNTESSDTPPTVVSALVVESLTPLFVRHGFDRTLAWLRRLQRQEGLILILPILREQLTHGQHQVLEDMTQSVVCLEQGQATWLRQGVRERGNLVRQVLIYEIVGPQTDEGGGGEDQDQPASLRLVQDNPAQPPPEEVSSAPMSKDSKPESTNNADHNKEHVSSRRPKKKMELTFSETSRPSKDPVASVDSVQPPNKTPQIIVEDDDPDFLDHDEDDPDDDLDI